nr:immunoglobulin heavy chain junction region [Macaca mulatta]MOV40777.1 immunoglobulin heavy chain junction region [Macaca mulatta]MOV43024.1 immunoglobulin heavy chain junction region [Macaca mulatta]MOV43038.1 immunoglobulin heavy chain junction region [Macaca mulatta]MOV46167.1 immunoglobulin heavy chain junction region [Macaca mulatta]
CARWSRGYFLDYW